MLEYSRRLQPLFAAALVWGSACDATLGSGLVFEPLPEALASASEGPCAVALDPTVSTGTGNPLCPDGTYSGDVRLVNAGFEALQGCARVAGSLSLELSTGEQLRALDALQVVDGSLVVSSQSGSAATTRPSHGLDQLRCVAGDLSLSRDAPLTGLGKLREVGGSLTIADGALSELPALSRVWGDLSAPSVVHMPALETIYGKLGPRPWSAAEWRQAAPRLSYVGCAAEFTPCRDGILGCDFEARGQADVGRLLECRHARADLQLQAADIYDLSALSQLQTVNGQLSIGPLSGDAALPTLSGLGQLRSVGALSLQNLTHLEDLEGLEMLERAGHIDVRACGNLKDLFGLSALREIQGRLRLVDNAALVALSGMPALRVLDELVVDGNASLTSIAGALSQVTRVTALTIEHNARLRNLDGADVLERARNLFVSGNAELTRLGRFPKLRSLDLLEVADSPRLTELGAFPALAGSEELELVLRNNARLPKLSGFEHIARAYNVSITGCNELTSLAGLRIRQIQNLLVLSSNAALTTLEGLDSLRDVAFVRIQANASLIDLSGLAGLRGSAAAIELRNNFALSDTSMLTNLGVSSLYVENDTP